MAKGDTSKKELSFTRTFQHSDMGNRENNQATQFGALPIETKFVRIQDVVHIIFVNVAISQISVTHVNDQLKETVERKFFQFNGKKEQITA